MKTVFCHRKWGVALCFLAALLLLWVCNSLWDSSYTYGFGDEGIVKASLARKLTGSSSTQIDEILPINVSYDRTLVSVTDAYGIPVGDLDITDRSKLLELLCRLNEYRNYRYILCDIAFNGELTSESDSLLYSLMASMPNLVIPGETDNLPDILRPVSAPSVYKIRHHGDPFLKYRFRWGDQLSLPLKMWQDLTGNDIVRHWYGYTFGKGGRCNNAAVPDIADLVGYANQHISAQEGDFAWEEKLIYHLGSDILATDCPRELFEDKIVLIGDYFEQDMHDTAIGQVPGVMLLYAAYRTLDEGKNRIPTWCLVLIFIIFFAYFLIIFYKFSWSFKDKLLTYLLDSVSFSFPLGVLNFLMMLFDGIAVNAVMFGAFFGILAYLRNIPIKK